MDFEPIVFDPTPPLKGSSDPFFGGAGDADPWATPGAYCAPASDPLRRVHSTSAIHAGGDGWPAGSGPLPIRHTRLGPGDHISSLESSQSVLHHVGSLTEESGIMQYGGPLPLPARDALAAVELGISQPPPPPPQQQYHSLRVPAPGGHWAWVPAGAGAPAPAPAPTPAGMVPVNVGALPLPVPMACDGGELDYLDSFLDSFDVLEMADNLAPAELPHLYPAGSRAPPLSRRAVGSCPLPTLLEDSLSAEDDGSDDTMLHARAAATFGGGMHHVGSLDRTASDCLTAGSRGPRGGVPIPGPRSAPLKLHRGPSRSASHPHLPSALASSLGSDRPMRTAARRSLAVTAAALRENMEDSDSEASEGGMPGSYGARRSGGSGSLRAAPHHAGSGAPAKKKHNPWSLEETLALVEGVRLAGVGKWAEIKRLPVPGVADVLESRTPVDLKDKWRNLTRVARLPKAALRQRLQRGPSDVPLETMLEVKQLMEAGQDAE